MTRAKKILESMNEGKMSDLDIALKELGVEFQNPVVRARLLTDVIHSGNPVVGVEMFLRKYPKFVAQKDKLLKLAAKKSE